MTEFHIVGKSPSRVGSVDIVTGKAKFTGDFRPPGLLHMKLVKSSYAHAKILNVDTSKAMRLPGVRAVLTAADVPKRRYGYGGFLVDRFILPCDNIVRFVGEPVALVVADTAKIAENAAKLVQVRYEELPAVFDAEEAIKENAPILHPESNKYQFTSLPRYPKIVEPGISNLMNAARLRTGNVRAGFEQADIVIENRYTFGDMQHCCLETHIAQAEITENGILLIRSSTQGPHNAQEDIASFLGMDRSKVRAIAPYVGGGFGCKAGNYLNVCVALAASKLRRPVMLTCTREEEFILGGLIPKVVVYLKDGVKRDGSLIAREAKCIVDCGAYAGDLLVIIPRTTLLGVTSPSYRIPNMSIDSYGVYTNKPPSAALRGVCIPEVNWAVEQQMDRIAEKLGIDPIELRRRNLAKVGDENVLGEPIESNALEECLGEIAKWLKEQPKPKEEGTWREGRGLALGCTPSYPGWPSSATIKLRGDSTMELRVGSVDLGQGSNTVLAQMAAEEFGIDFDKVQVISADTAIVPFSGQTSSSRTTMSAGVAVQRACRDAKRQLLELGASTLRAPIEELEIREGKLCRRGKAEQISIFDLIGPRGLIKEVGELLGRGENTFLAPPIDPETGRVKRLGYWSYGAYGVELAVNIETGEVRISKVIGAFEMGQPIHPKLCEGQIDGCIGMGIGHALYEQLILDKGSILNSTLYTYRLPTAMEVPSGENVKYVLLTSPHPEGPYGAKGFGEVPLAMISPAIANAIFDAVGIRMNDAPISREAVLKLLKGLKEDGR